MKKIILTVLVANGLLFANDGEQLVKNNGCMECHNIMGKKLAPAFMGTARKNIRWFSDDAKQKIIESIKNGSKGKYKKFTNTEMPAFNHLTDKELNNIADWILNEYVKNKKLHHNKSKNAEKE